MTRDVYKTANGKALDMGALRLQNEQVRAVGNMKVNARGDIVNDENQVLSSKPQQVAKQQRKLVQTPPPGVV